MPPHRHTARAKTSLLVGLSCALACSSEDRPAQRISAQAAVPQQATGNEPAPVLSFRAQDLQAGAVDRWANRADGPDLIQPDPQRRPSLVRRGERSLVRTKGDGRGLVTEDDLGLRGDAAFTLVWVGRILEQSGEAKHPIALMLGSPDLAAGGFGLQVGAEFTVATGHYFDVAPASPPDFDDELFVMLIRHAPGPLGDTTTVRLDGQTVAMFGKAPSLNLKDGPLWLGGWGSQPAAIEVAEFALFDDDLDFEQLRAVECAAAWRHAVAIAGGDGC